MFEYVSTSIVLKKFKEVDINELIIKNSLAGYHNYKMTVNKPFDYKGNKRKMLYVNRILFKVELLDKIINLGITDYTDIDSKALKEMENFKNIFFNAFGKYPTTIYHNGIGFNILIKLDKTLNINSFRGANANSLMFIYDYFYKYYHKHKLFKFKAIFDDYANDNFDSDRVYKSIVSEMCPVPILQTVLKKNGKSKVWRNTIKKVEHYDTIFNLVEMAETIGSKLFDNKEVSQEVKQGIKKVIENKSETCIFTGEFHKQRIYNNGVYTCFDCGKTISFENLYKEVIGVDFDIDKRSIPIDQLIKYLKAVTFDNDDLIYKFVTPLSSFTIYDYQISNKIGRMKLKRNNVIYNTLKEVKKFHNDLNYLIDSNKIDIKDKILTGIHKDFVILNSDYSVFFTNEIKSKVTDLQPTVELTNFGEAPPIDEVVSNIMSIGKEYFANVLSIVFDLLFIPSFELKFGMSPLFMVYGTRDSGKTSFVNFVQSIFTNKYEQLSISYSNPFDFLDELRKYSNIPLLADEYTRYIKKRDTDFFQVLKEISTNGRKIKLNGKTKRRKSNAGNDIKGVTVLCSEFRPKILDPSLYQRTIEINMDLLFKNFSMSNIINFRKALIMNKFNLADDIFSWFYKDKKSFKDLSIMENELFKEYFDRISGKKKFVMLLHIVGIKTAYEYLNKFDYTKEEDINYHILKYLKGETLHNGEKVRKSDIKEIVLSFIISQVKVRATDILSNLSISVNKKSANILFNKSILMALGFQNEHLFNELDGVTGSRKSIVNNIYRPNRKIQVSHFEINTLIRTIKDNTSYELEAIKDLETILGGYKK